jgi:hypothetical protein
MGCSPPRRGGPVLRDPGGGPPAALAASRRAGGSSRARPRAPGVTGAWPGVLQDCVIVGEGPAA